MNSNKRNFIASMIALAISGVAHAHEGHSHGPETTEAGPTTGPITLTDATIHNLDIQTVEATIAPLQRTMSMIGRIEGLPERLGRRVPEHHQGGNGGPAAVPLPQPGQPEGQGQHRGGAYPGPGPEGPPGRFGGHGPGFFLPDGRVDVAPHPFSGVAQVAGICCCPLSAGRVVLLPLRQSFLFFVRMVAAQEGAGGILEFFSGLHSGALGLGERSVSIVRLPGLYPYAPGK